MLRKLVTLVVAVLTCAGIGILGTAATAGASIASCGDGPYPTYMNIPDGCAYERTTGVFINNGDTRVHYAWCLDKYFDQAGYVYIDKLNLGENSERSCTNFDVLNRERVLYQSIATGTQYWTPCGQSLPYFSPRSPNGGFWSYDIGNSVKILKHVSYPTAPANVC
jgi:hypothetical protein